MAPHLKECNERWKLQKSMLHLHLRKTIRMFVGTPWWRTKQSSTLFSQTIGGESKAKWQTLHFCILGFGLFQKNKIKLFRFRLYSWKVWKVTFLGKLFKNLNWRHFDLLDPSLWNSKNVSYTHIFFLPLHSLSSFNIISFLVMHLSHLTFVFL